MMSPGQQSSPTSTDAPALELYEYEACPYCGRVRRALLALDLGYLCRTCARGSAKRVTLATLGGKVQLPFLIDHDAGTELYESAGIVAHLERHYGRRRSLMGKLLSPLSDLWSAAAGLTGGTGGLRVRAPRPVQPAKPLELVLGHDGAAAAAVRATLCELDLDYLLLDSAAGARRADAAGVRLADGDGAALIDPNAGEAVGGFDKVIVQLERRYG